MLTLEQLERRKQGIGGNDAPAILGIDPYRTKMDIWLAKTHKKSAADELKTSAMHWGNLLEDIIAKEYARVTGREIEICSDTLVHAEHTWMLGHIDRFVLNDSRILECKTASFKHRNLWGRAGSERIPRHYRVQVQHYMAVTNTELADVAVLIGGNDFRIYSIPRDEQLINDIIEQEYNFWHKYVLTDIPPEIKPWGC